VIRPTRLIRYIRKQANAIITKHKS